MQETVKYCIYSFISGNKKKSKRHKAKPVEIKNEQNRIQKKNIKNKNI